MLNENKDLIFVVFYIVMARFENLNNSQNLQIVSFVLSFYKDHFLKKKGY